MISSVFACGDSGGPGRSGVAPTKQLVDINDADIDQLCDWLERTAYAPNETQYCTEEGVFLSSDADSCRQAVAQCKAELEPGDLDFSCRLDASSFAGCEATVRDYEDCVLASRSSARRYYESLTCSDLDQDDEEPLPSACKKLVSKCSGSGDDDGWGEVDSDDEDDDYYDGGFVCEDGTDIDDDWLCDGATDCPYGEDEERCSDAELGLFTCADGTRVDEDYTCDQQADCPDASDEFDCDGGFVCDDGVDIFNDLHCDGYPDCADGEDELDCGYPCSDGTYIPTNLLCNGADDCRFGDDEDGCPAPGDRYTCIGGGTIPSDYLCDEELDCPQGDDESGCGP